ncbi:MAG: agmatine deiminase family protein [Bacteroidales bacterium]|nr:agmatine deiminase family protein [Bacteroidales bacterium]
MQKTENTNNIITWRMPAEWEEHQATLLSFPHEGRDWPGKFGAIQWAFVEIIRKVAQYEPVILIVKSKEHQAKVLEMLNRAHANVSAISFIECDTNRNWMRDSGPIIVKDGNKRQALKFGFNGWAKYPNYRKDLKIPGKVAEFLGIDLIEVKHKGRPVVLEGGAIDVNGCGTLLTTEECLLSKEVQVRNPGFTKEDYETVFYKYLGITKVIWLSEGIQGDDTHGHVDDIARFVNPNTIIACTENEEGDYNHKKLAINLEILQNSQLQDGSRPEIVKLPMPGRINFEDMRLPASYINFLILNNCVLVPTFNDKNDYKAIGIVNELFPERDVIGINATDLIWGLGTIHCLSHEIVK